MIAPATARRIRALRLSALDPARPAAIKRNVHELTIDRDARWFAGAFAAVLVEPGSDFAGLRLERLPDRTGLPFVVGERFQSAFRLGGWSLIEDRLASDFAEIVEIAFDAPPYVAHYRYLEGGPLAGGSTFVIAPDGPDRCRFTARFEFQEIGPLGITILHRFGIRAHDEVVRCQVERAAARLGGRVVASTIRSASPPRGTCSPSPAAGTAA
jgi:hypothetical protein